ncbi:hypothetical protein Hanom_Chr14g01324101 [Helianthus anomalus]
MILEKVREREISRILRRCDVLTVILDCFKTPLRRFCPSSFKTFY